MSNDRITYSTYELYPDGTEEYVGSFSITEEESVNALRKHSMGAYHVPGRINGYALIIVMFETIYLFTKGTNGFMLNWNDSFESDGFITWKINTWRIKRVEEDGSEQSVSS